MGGRLVDEQQLRLAHKRTRKPHQLALSARDWHTAIAEEGADLRGVDLLLYHHMMLLAVDKQMVCAGA